MGTHTVDIEEHDKIACFPIAYLSCGYSGKRKKKLNLLSFMLGISFGLFIFYMTG